MFINLLEFTESLNYVVINEKYKKCFIQNNIMSFNKTRRPFIFISPIRPPSVIHESAISFDRLVSLLDRVKSINELSENEAIKITDKIYEELYKEKFVDSSNVIVNFSDIHGNLNERLNRYYSEFIRISLEINNKKRELLKSKTTEEVSNILESLRKYENEMINVLSYSIDAIDRFKRQLIYSVDKIVESSHIELPDPILLFRIMMERYGLTIYTLILLDNLENNTHLIGVHLSNKLERHAKHISNSVRTFDSINDKNRSDIINEIMDYHIDSKFVILPFSSFMRIAYEVNSSFEFEQNSIYNSIIDVNSNLAILFSAVCLSNNDINIIKHHLAVSF